MTGASRHPFEVGRQYRNEHGAYTVVRIQESDMVIRYADGRTLVSPIALQARIWERICEEEALAAAEKSARASSRGRSRTSSRMRLGRDFQGLNEADFDQDVTGTSWRRRPELGGLLAGRLAALSGQPFESHAVYRRSEVYIALPQFFTPGDSFRSAKFFFSLNERETFHGFVIEKSNESMDSSWDWPRCIDALLHDKRLQAQVLVAMQASDLAWEIDTSVPQEDKAHTVRTVTASDETLRLRTEDGGATPLSWPDFVALLEAVPSDQWCDLYLAARMAKARAIELGVELAQEVAAIYYALLPLYMAAVRVRAAGE